MEHDAQTLYVHSKRPSWGPAILAWEGSERRRLQFRDGKLRTFRRGFYHLLKEVDMPLDRAAEISYELENKLGLSRARNEVMEDLKAKGRAKPITVDQQVAYFREQYPEGFEDAAYIEACRRRDGKPLRRHREPACERAATLLGRDRLQAALDAGQPRRVVDALTEALSGTDLVQPTRRKALQALGESDVAEFAAALFGVLWSDAPLGDRFARWQAALDKLPEHGWRLATAPLALVFPADHITVTSTVFAQQAKWMAPQLKLGSAVCAKDYVRVLGMTSRVQRRLEQAELQPRDFMDVYDFIRVTLSAPARKAIRETS